MIDLHTPLSLRTSLAFPLQNRLARREVLIGAALLLVPVIGWLLNMGHRVMMVHRMQQGLPAWPAWRDYRQLLRHGAITFAGMVCYHAPGGLLLGIAWITRNTALGAVAVALLVVATLAVPGYMTHYCRELDPAEILDPRLALRRAMEGGTAYWRAWGIALLALLLSFAGLAAVGVGFLVTSVWFWQAAGFSFARVFTPSAMGSAQSPPVAAGEAVPG